jgi:hypothetical protein
MSWLYSQALVAEYLGENFWDGEQSVQLSVMPTQAKFWRNDKDDRILKPFPIWSDITTFDGKPWAGIVDVVSGGFHAKTLAQQEKAQELKVQEAECGRKWQGLLAKYDQDTHSWKTAQCSLLEDLEQSLQTWPRWGLMRNGACYQQPMLVQTTSEKEFGYWLPTPVASDATTGAIIGRNDKFYQTKSGMPRKINQNGKNGSVGLARLVQMWPTPDANMGRRNATRVDPIRKSGQPAQYTINQAVRDTEQANGGKLKPTWVEWLMGWPLGWTDLKPLEMDKCHYAQQQHLNCLEKG